MQAFIAFDWLSNVSGSKAMANKQNLGKVSLT